MLLVFFISCNKINKSIEEAGLNCGSSNPIEELVWLKKAIEDSKKDIDLTYCAIAKYKGESVIIIVNCNPPANTITYIHNCKGDILGEKNNLLSDLSDIRLLWNEDRTKCQY